MVILCTRTHFQRKRTFFDPCEARRKQSNVHTVEKPKLSYAQSEMNTT